jgi:hypothetical protein
VKKMIAALLSSAAVAAASQERAWDPAAVKPCDRSCLTSTIDRYVDALAKKDRSPLALARDVRFTENTAQLDLGEGILWRARVEPTAFRIHVADPAAGQVALQTVLTVEGRPALAAVRLKVDRGQIQEVEQLVDPNVAPAAMELLRTPRPGLVNDVAPSDRSSRDVLIWAANSYFDALEGDSGTIGAFAPDCVRHEQGYQTVNHRTPSRAAPSPNIPTGDTPQGRFFLKLSTMTCAEQIDTKVFSYMKRIRPRRALVVDEQKGLVATFPLFVHDGTRRSDSYVGFPEMKPGLGMIMNMVTMETFGIRGGLIHEVEAFPFITIPYGLGNGWTPGAGR